MNCKQTQSNFCDYVDETVDQATRAAIESHLSGCVACRMHYSFQQKLHESVSSAAAAESAALHFRPQPLTAGFSGTNRRPSIIMLTERLAPVLPALLLICVIFWPLLKPDPRMAEAPAQSDYVEAYHSIEKYGAANTDASSFAVPVVVIIQPNAPARIFKLDGSTDISAELK